MDEVNKIGIIILAAGASIRFGKPKQLLKISKRETLIGRIAKMGFSTGLQTVVVLGANAEKIKPVLNKLPVEIVINNNWESGMSSSIVTGLNKLLEIQTDLKAVILLLGDQPLITKEIVLEIIEVQKDTQKSIVASKYGETIGVPALFTKKVFDELLALNEEIGAKSIIKKYSDTDVEELFLPEAESDIDTIVDFERLEKILQENILPDSTLT